MKQGCLLRKFLVSAGTALAALAFCAACQQLAIAQTNPVLVANAGDAFVRTVGVWNNFLYAANEYTRTLALAFMMSRIPRPRLTLGTKTALRVAGP